MTKGSRVLGAVSGAVAGIGLAVLLQQFAVVPLTTAVLVGLPVGLAFVGVGAGWPRRRGGAPSTESHPGRPDAPPPGAGRPSAPAPSDQAATSGSDAASSSAPGGST